MLEAKACKVSHSSVPALKANLEAVWADIPAEVVRASCAKVEERLRAVVAKRGGYVENC